MNENPVTLPRLRHAENKALLHWIVDDHENDWDRARRLFH